MSYSMKILAYSYIYICNGPLDGYKVGPIFGSTK